MAMLRMSEKTDRRIVNGCASQVKRTALLSISEKVQSEMVVGRLMARAVP